MTADTEVCNDAVRKVEVEDSDMSCDGKKVGVADCNGGGTGSYNHTVGVNRKDDSDDSSYVFVGVESAEANDTDMESGNVDVTIPKSDSADEIKLAKNELELGVENGGEYVDESATVKEVEAQAVEEEVNIENGLMVDSSLTGTNGIAQQNASSQLGDTTSEGPVVVVTDAVEVNGMTNTEAELDELDPGVKFESESTPNPIEASQVTLVQLECTPEPIIDSESQVTITPSISPPNLKENMEPQVLLDDAGCTDPLEKTDSGVPVDRLESTENLVEDPGCQITVGKSESTVNPTEKPECHVRVDESVSTGKPTEDIQCQVRVDGPQFTDKPTEDTECLLTDDGPESAGILYENSEVRESLVESARRSEDHQESLVITSEVNVVAEPIHVEHQIESETTADLFEEQKDGGSVVESALELEDRRSVVMSFLAAEVSADAEECKLDQIGIELGETEMPHREANGSQLSDVGCQNVKSDEQVEKQDEKQVEESSESLVESEEVKFGEMKELAVNENNEYQVVATNKGSQSSNGGGQNVKSDEQVEKQVDESSESLVKSEEVKFEEANELVEIVNENNERQTVATANVQNNLDPDDDTTVSFNKAEEPLETEATSNQITNESRVSQNEGIETSTCVLMKESTVETEVLVSTDSVKSECKNEEMLVEKDKDSSCGPDDMISTGRQVECGASLGMEKNSAADMDCRTEIETLDVKCSSPEDEPSEIDKDAPVRGQSASNFSAAAYVSPGTVIEFGSIGRHLTTPTTHHNDVSTVSEVSNGDTETASGANSDNPEENLSGSQGDISDQTDNKLTCKEVEDTDGVQSDGNPTSSAEDSVSDVIDGQNEEAEVPPYNFLIKIPRFEDEKLREQIKNAQLQVDEKTRHRDAIRAQIQGKRARLQAHDDAYQAAKSEETAARALVRLKRQEIDSVQIVINRVKNAISVEDIDGRIYNMEHMIQHETLCLKDEKQFIREIKQLKTLRDQLASNMGSQDEIKQALDQKDQVEERLKNLRKELDSLKDKVSRAAAVTLDVGKKYDEESRKVKELQAQFKAADDVRQEAYAHLNSLKRQLYDKNKTFRTYKDDLIAARDFASRGDKDSLHRLCANQVETFMEIWNTNDEFRKEYIGRCNMYASRRLRAVDGRSLGPDEVPPLLPNNVNGRVDSTLVSVPGEAKSISVVSGVGQGKIVSPVEDKQADNKLTERVPGKKNHVVKTKELEKNSLASGTATVEGRDDAGDNRKEQEQTREELELASKAEQLRKEQIDAKLKEQRRLEEKAKAIEALERKKRNAEKAQMRAQLRAKREAEQKEKEREKRLRKKEKKRGGGDGQDGSVNGEDTGNSESSNEATVKEIESVKENRNVSKRPAKPPPHFFTKQHKPKPVPPPLSIRNKKRWQQWGKVIVAAALVLALFLLGNTGFFLNLRLLRSNGGSV